MLKECVWRSFLIGDEIDVPFCHWRFVTQVLWTKAKRCTSPSEDSSTCKRTHLSRTSEPFTSSEYRCKRSCLVPDLFHKFGSNPSRVVVGTLSDGQKQIRLASGGFRFMSRTTTTVSRQKTVLGYGGKSPPPPKWTQSPARH